MKKYFIFLLLFLIKNSFAYVATRTEYNQNLVWDSRSDTLDIYVDARPVGGNSSSLTESKVKNIVDEVISSWEVYSPYKLEHSYTTNLPSIATSRTIRFTDDASYFGSGVLAVTSVSHSAATGKIYSADILINGSTTNPNTFTDDKSVSGGYYAYLGDVLAHEMGHLLGLGHSDVFGSTMVFSVFKGQHTLHTDDISGLDYLYSNINQGGSITGEVITGEGIPVFGAQVQAISYNDGSVIAGVFSESDGSFVINELPKNNSYLIYILPPRGVENLPIYYQSIQTRYCSGSSFVPSFFTKCGGSNKGRPQVISLEDNSSVDIGSVTIRCDEGMDPLYLYGKAKNEKVNIQKVSNYNKKNALGATYVGYFSKNEISNGLIGTGDKLEIDLRDYTVPEDTLYYLNIKLVTKEIGSAMGLFANIYDANDNLITSQDISYGPYSERETDLEFNINLSTDEAQNLFTVEVFPRSLSNTELNEIFANYSVMTNENSTYLALTSIKSYQSGEYKAFALKDSAPYEDNYYCSEGEASVTARPNVYSSAEADGISKDSEANAPNAMSCGTIDIDQGGGPSGGMMSFSLGVLIIFLMAFMGRKSNDFFV